MSPGEAIDRIRGQVPGAELIGELYAGVVSHSFRVRAGGAELVMRVDRPLAARLQLDRVLEAQLMGHAASAGLAPRVIALDARPPAILLRAFVPGRAWAASDLADAQNAARLCALLRAVHALPSEGFRGRGELADAIRNYTAMLGAPARALGERGLAMLRKLAASAPWPATLCHRDPTPGNIIEDPSGRLWLNDWEYAGVGDRLFDVAVAGEGCDYVADAYVENPAAAGLAARIAEFRILYALILVLWFQVIDREQGLTGDQRRKLRESEQFLATIC